MPFFVLSVVAFHSTHLQCLASCLKLVVGNMMSSLTFFWPQKWLLLKNALSTACMVFFIKTMMTSVWTNGVKSISFNQFCNQRHREMGAALIRSVEFCVYDSVSLRAVFFYITMHDRTFHRTYMRTLTVQTPGFNLIDVMLIGRHPEGINSRPRSDLDLRRILPPSSDQPGQERPQTAGLGEMQLPYCNGQDAGLVFWQPGFDPRESDGQPSRNLMLPSFAGRGGAKVKWRRRGDKHKRHRQMLGLLKSGGRTHLPLPCDLFQVMGSALPF